MSIQMIPTVPKCISISDPDKALSSRELLIKSIMEHSIGDPEHPNTDIYINRGKWRVLSMTYVGEVYVMYHGHYYANIYRALYANLFPSHHAELSKMSPKDIQDQGYPLMQFEISDTAAEMLLHKLIDYKFRHDNVFRRGLLSTGIRELIYIDLGDRFYGGSGNLYGKTLMKYRKAILDRLRIHATPNGLLYDMRAQKLITQVPGTGDIYDVVDGLYTFDWTRTSVVDGRTMESMIAKDIDRAALEVYDGQ